ncbi:MAG: mandelate racemase/muconate lactonizing enzyme family protein, partial [Alphaproteobacteria bacterium]|nr:mandelate racemase/muconate lactonizing enzyme family protein [Alphaproteobacteria bacterium]
MRIARIEAVALEATFARQFGGIENVPPQLLRPAAHFQKIVRAGQYATFALVTSDDGLTGIGEAFGLPHPTPTAILIEKVIAPGLVGSELGDPHAMLTEYRSYFAALGHAGGMPAEALSGVDMALWDLKAKAAGKPLCAALGGTPGPVPLYASPVPFLPTIEASQAAARKLVAEGYKAIKLKIGRGAAVDLDHIAAVREAIGPEVGLMLDVNCGYDEATASDVGRRLSDHAITWFEEPIPPGDPAALARVRAKSSVPIAAGENEFDPRAFEALARAGAVDVLMPNIARAGGVSGMMALGQLCARHGVGLAPHGVGSCVAVAAALQVCRAAPGFRIYEANRLMNPLRDAMPKAALRLVDGAFLTPDGPGHGGDPKPEVMASYRLV